MLFHKIIILRFVIQHVNIILKIILNIVLLIVQLTKDMKYNHKENSAHLTVKIYKIIHISKMYLVFLDVLVNTLFQYNILYVIQHVNIILKIIVNIVPLIVQNNNNMKY